MERTGDSCYGYRPGVGSVSTQELVLCMAFVCVYFGQQETETNFMKVPEPHVEKLPHMFKVYPDLQAETVWDVLVGV